MSLILPYHTRSDLPTFQHCPSLELRCSIHLSGKGTSKAQTAMQTFYTAKFNLQLQARMYRHAFSPVFFMFRVTRKILRKNPKV